MEIAQNVHLVTSAVSNSYMIVDSSGLTLIDAGLPNNAPKILKHIQSLGYHPDDLRRIIITHADIDHVGGLEDVRIASHAMVATTQVEADAIRLGQPSRPLRGGWSARILKAITSMLFKARPSQVDQILTSSDEFPLLGGLQVILTPGHTPGHISLWSPSTKILFSGDSILIHPDRFLPSQGMNNWDEIKSKESFRLQAGLHPAIVCGGHGWTGQDVDQKFSRYTELEI